MKTCLFIACFLALVSLRAEDITLRDGTVLKNARVTEATPAFISVTHNAGVAHVMLQDLPADLQKKYGYDPAKAAEYAAADAAAQQQIQQQIANQEAARHAAQQQQKIQPASPPDPHATIEAQIRDIQKQRERLQIEIDRVHVDQRDLPPPNSSVVRRHHVKSIRSSPNAAALANQEKDLRKQIDELNYKEKLLRWQLK